MNAEIDRRHFLLGLAATMPIAAHAQAPRLENLSQWLEASRQRRERALQPCLDRIKEMDPAIKAWVQVSP